MPQPPHRDQTTRARPSDPAPPPCRRVDSRELIGPHGTLLIEHAGSLYCLRVTRTGKLILTK